MKTLLALVCLVISAGSASAGADSTYSLEGHIGGGFVKNLSSFDVAPPGNLSQSGFNGYARFLWSPEHLLDLGLEFGITELYSITPPDSSPIDKSTLVAYPIYMVMSMQPVDRLHCTVGFGAAILSSVVVEPSGITGVTSFTTSVYLSAAYLQPLNDALRLGGEVRATSFDRYRDFNLSFNIVLAASLIHY